MLRKTILFTIIVLLSTVYAWSQEVNTSVTFSLEEAVQHGLQNNLDFKNTQLDADILREQAFEVMTEGFPKISGSVDYNYYFKQQTQIIPQGSFVSEDPLTGMPNPPEDLEVIFGFPQNATIQAEAQQLIFDARYIYGLKARKAFLSMADAQTEQGRIVTEEEITKAYYMALVAEETYKELTTNEAVLQDMLYETQRLYEEGFVDELSVDRLALNLSNIQTRIAAARQQAENTKLQMHFLLHVPYEQELILSDDLSALVNGTLEESDVSGRVEDRIEMQILTIQNEIRLYDIKQARSNYFPSVYAYASYGTQAFRQQFNFFDSERWFDVGLVGVSINVPIFDGLTARSQVQQRKLKKTKTINDLERLRSSYKVQTEVAKHNLQVAIREYQTQGENLELARKILHKTSIMYQEGVGGSFEVSEAQTALTQTQIQYTQAIYNLLVAKLELNKAFGKL